MIDVRSFVQSVTHEASSLDLDRLRAQLAEYSLARVRGLFDRDAARAAMARIAAGFDPRRDQKHDPRDTEAVRRNFQKLQVGAGSGIDSRRTLGRFMRVLYNPIFDEDVLGMREHFVTLARFRNRLYGLDPDFAIAGTDQGLFTCARIHQYPRGGGFMVPHRDLFSQEATVAAGLAYYQVFLCLTECGVDYREGGAYIDRGSDRIPFEREAQAGDVFVYDGRSVHGVADIDPLAPLELDRFTGRAAAFVSLYRHLEPGRGYARLSADAEKRFGLDGF